MRHASKLFLVLATVAAALTLAACGGDDNGDTTDTGGANATAPQSNDAAKNEGAESGKPRIPTIVIRNGEPVGGVEELEYSAGDEIRFGVKSNVADEVHVHGYDVEKEVPAGGTATLSFPADIEGIFEVELHGSGTQIAELRVNP